MLIRESYAFTHVTEVKGPVYGSKAWAERKHSEMFEKELEHFQAEQELSKRINGDFE